MRWKGLHFPSFEMMKKDEISTEDLSSERREASLSAGGHFEYLLVAERNLGYLQRSKDPEEADSSQHQWVI